MKLLILSCALVALVAAEVDLKASFQLMDTDNNDHVSRQEYKDAAKTGDSNRDGNLDVKEWWTQGQKDGMSHNQITYLWVMHDLNEDRIVNETESMTLFPWMDTDKDTYLTYPEYASVMYAIGTQVYVFERSEADLMKLFELADEDKNGVLNEDKDLKNEYYETFGLVSEAGLDKKGYVSKESFVKYWKEETKFTTELLELIFDMFDGDGDKLFGTSADKKEAFKVFDTDSNGQVNETEYISVMIGLFHHAVGKVEQKEVATMMNGTNVDAAKVFGMLDADKNKQFTQAEMETSANSADKSGDGNLNVTEFIGKYMQAGFQWRGALMLFYLVDANGDMDASDIELRTMFHREDRNGDGYVSEEELKYVIKGEEYMIHMAAFALLKLGNLYHAADYNSDDRLSGQELWYTIAAADEDMSGTVTEKEFMHFFTLRSGLDKKISHNVFQMLDRNRDGVIGGDPEKKMLFDSFDFDGDDVVSKEEFANVMLYYITKGTERMYNDIRTYLQGRYNMTLAFDMMDNNTDGKVEKKEIGHFLESMDDDDDSELSAEEFIKGFMQTGLSVEGALYMFFRVNRDGDQKYTKKEFTEGFKGADLNDDMVWDRNEYNSMMTHMVHELQEASDLGYRLTLVFHAYNPNKDGNLTRSMMKYMILDSDKNGDGSVSREEFVAFWMETLGEPSDRSNMMFNILDADNDGTFGNDMEMEDTFDGFDDDDDQLVSEKEFLYGNLYLFAEVMELLEPKA